MLFQSISHQGVPAGNSVMRTVGNIKKKFYFSSDHLTHSIVIQILVVWNFN